MRQSRPEARDTRKNEILYLSSNQVEEDPTEVYEDNEACIAQIKK